MKSRSTQQAVVHLQGLGVIYTDRNTHVEALREISFNLASQEFICVLGPSGCGKTTLLRVVAGLLKPTSGKIQFAGGRQPRVGLVFQQANLMPWRSVADNISLPLEISGDSQVEITRKRNSLLNLVGLQEFADAWPAALSGGMAQRVAIARALIHNPKLLLLDEPFGSLDALTRERMGSELMRIWQAHRKSVIMVTHSISEAILLADRVLVLTSRPGRICLELQVDLPRPRTEELRYSPPFMKLARHLREAIQE